MVVEEMAKKSWMKDEIKDLQKVITNRYQYKLIMPKSCQKSESAFTQMHHCLLAFDFEFRIIFLQEWFLTKVWKPRLTNYFTPSLE